MLRFLLIGYFIAGALGAPPAGLSAVASAKADAAAEIPADVVRVIDGDTFVADLHPLPDTTRPPSRGLRWAGRLKVRVADLDTPELRGKCPEEKRLARGAKARATELLGARVVLVIRGGGRPFDAFGRLLAAVRLGDGRSLAAVLIAEGLGRPWTGRREPWCGP